MTPKFAIALFGHVRNFEQTRTSLVSNLFEINPKAVKVAAVWNDVVGHKRYILPTSGQRAIMENGVSSDPVSDELRSLVKNHIGKLCEFILPIERLGNSTIENLCQIKGSMVAESSSHPAHRPVANFLQWSIREKAIAKTPPKSFVLSTRLDVMLTGPINLKQLSTSDADIVFDQSEQHAGLSDIAIFGKREKLLTLFNYLQNEAVFDCLAGLVSFDPHLLLIWSLNKLGMSYVSLPLPVVLFGDIYVNTTPAEIFTGTKTNPANSKVARQSTMHPQPNITNNVAIRPRKRPIDEFFT